MFKSQIQRIVRDTVIGQSASLTREEKWNVFNLVCDRLYSEGRITLKQHESLTSPFWSPWCDSWTSGTTPLGKPLHTCYTIFIPKETNMVIDTDNYFTTDNDLLQAVSQFILSLNNKLISQNEDFMKSVGIDTLTDFNQQLILECEEYKCYDV